MRAGRAAGLVTERSSRIEPTPVAPTLTYQQGDNMADDMIRWCTECEADREHDEAFEDRFDPGSMYGHYQVSAGLICLECGNEFVFEEII